MIAKHLLMPSSTSVYLSQLPHYYYYNHLFVYFRRLAKSTLILIPIFGLHFIFFAWLPYARIANDDSLIELPVVYIETFFNAFQVKSYNKSYFYTFTKKPKNYYF